mmetsp:Transcript_20940/g.41799  ORF Transcript_20940/g.41799 Transcript_20940/m.41799 type:complete len:136 (+) Transcript_20940:1173-1580(+)
MPKKLMFSWGIFCAQPPSYFCPGKDIHSCRACEQIPCKPMRYAFGFSDAFQAQYVIFKSFLFVKVHSSGSPASYVGTTVDSAQPILVCLRENRVKNLEGRNCEPKDKGNSDEESRRIRNGRPALKSGVFIGRVHA